MIRRNFIQQITIGSASGLAAAGLSQAKEGKVVTYKIDGFTCVTCAVGLEVMLRQQKGIARAKASYPDRQVIIAFDPDVISEESIKKFISDIGFSVSGAV